MAPRNEATPAVLMVDAIPDLSFYTYTGQFFARWSYEKVDGDGTLLDLADTDAVGGYGRVDNITDEALRRWRTAYGDDVTRDDVFHYVYGLLHSPGYRARYAADLKKMLPRIPLVEHGRRFMDAGRRLSEIHLGSETAVPYPLGDPRYIVDLLARVVTVSLETMQVVDALPALVVLPDQR